MKRCQKIASFTEEVVKLHASKRQNKEPGKHHTWLENNTIPHENSQCKRQKTKRKKKKRSTDSSNLSQRRHKLKISSTPFPFSCVNTFLKIANQPPPQGPSPSKQQNKRACRQASHYLIFHLCCKEAKEYKNMNRRNGPMWRHQVPK